MHEIVKRSIGQTAKNRVLGASVFVCDLIPADVRNTHAFREFDHLTWQQSQSPVDAEFVPLVKHHLQTNAYAKDGFAPVCRFGYQFIKPEFTERLDRVSECADAKQYQLVSRA